MNHSIPGVNAGYVTRHKLVEDHLRSQQQAISSVMFSALGKLRTEHGAVIEWRRYPGSNDIVAIPVRQAGLASGAVQATARHDMPFFGRGRRHSIHHRGLYCPSFNIVCCGRSRKQ